MDRRGRSVPASFRPPNGLVRFSQSCMSAVVGVLRCRAPPGPPIFLRREGAAAQVEYHPDVAPRLELTHQLLEAGPGLRICGPSSIMDPVWSRRARSARAGHHPV